MLGVATIALRPYAAEALHRQASAVADANRDDAAADLDHFADNLETRHIGKLRVATDVPVASITTARDLIGGG